MRHLSRIQKVRRVPVLEISGGAELLDGTVQIWLPAMEAIKQGQRIDTFQATPALRQQARAHQLVLHGGRGHELLGFSDQVRMDPARQRMLLHEHPDMIDVRIESDEPRVS